MASCIATRSGIEVVVRDAAVDSCSGIREMVDEDLLGEEVRAAETFTAELGVAGRRRRTRAHELDRGTGGDGHVDNYNTSLMERAKRGIAVVTASVQGDATGGT
ncbi:MAG: hypothetical protein R2697_14240 [Ilumatobacteraceae bacterium]